jgi:hypothetical protein
VYVLFGDCLAVKMVGVCLLCTVRLDLSPTN